jgi:hypothetical protein
LVVKYQEGTTTGLEGVTFALYRESVSDTNFVSRGQTDSEVRLDWPNLEPGDYVGSAE